MSKCAVIVNRLSGNSRRFSRETLLAAFGKGFETDFVEINEETVLDDLTEYDRLVICGGDGTLNSVLNCAHSPSAEKIYCPSGTLNELATGNSNKDDYLLHEVGMVGDRLFAYVCACGIFTSLGYVVKNSNKRRYKWLAYLWKVAKLYRIEDIRATFRTASHEESGVYTLIMAIDSPKCFGFRFNCMYRLDDGKLHLLAIRAPKRKKLLGAIRVFFPLFRAFFIGFKHEYRSKNMFFVPFDDINIELEQKTDFCLDGERYPLESSFCVKVHRLPSPLRILLPRTVKKLAKGEYSL